jgi:hypothetical protein
MKNKIKILLFFPLFLLLSLSLSAQSEWMIDLSTKIPDARMGAWTRGDYTILVNLDSISTHFRRCQHSITRSLEYYKDQDSNLANYFRATQNRYGRAATQLEQAANGFDLKTLVIYEGVESVNRNLEDFRILESYLKNLVEQGKALVYFKAERIYTLCCISELMNQGHLETVQDILNQGYEIRTFYEEPANSLFIDYSIMGW